MIFDDGLFISRIKLVNFIQFHHTDTVEYEFDPITHRVVIIVGPTGRGKSALMGEMQPFPSIHGSPTIRAGIEGLKEIEYMYLNDDSVVYSIRHIYVPKPKGGHTVKSFFYKSVNGIQTDIYADGFSKDFYRNIKEIFGVTTKNIKVSGIGLKYGKSKFNLISSSDTERYIFIKDILEKLGEAKEREDYLNEISKMSKRRIGELQSVLSRISNTDFERIKFNIENELDVYDKTIEDIAIKKSKLDDELKESSGVSREDIEKSRKELLNVRVLIDMTKGIDGDLVEFFKNFKRENAELNSEINALTQQITNERSNLKELEDKIVFKSTKSEDEIMNTILELQKGSDSLDDIELSRIEDTREKVFKLKGLIDNITVAVPLHKYFSFSPKDSEQIRVRIERLKQEIESIMNEEPMDHTAVKFHNLNDDKCNCNAYKLKKEIDLKMERVNQRSGELHKLGVELSELEDIDRENFEIERNLSKLTILKGIVDDLIQNSSLIVEKTHEMVCRNIADILLTLDMKKNNYMTRVKIQELQRELEVIRNESGVRERINTLKDSINGIQNKLLELNRVKEDRRVHVFSNINRDSETLLFTYYNTDLLNKRYSELVQINHEYSEIDNKSKKLMFEISRLNEDYSRIKVLISSKRDEISRTVANETLFKDTTKALLDELERGEKISTLREIFAKRIPMMVLEGTLDVVKEEANEFLSDIDRYSIEKIDLNSVNNRNTFDIIIRDTDVTKSASLLSNGEESLIHLAITVPLSRTVNDRYTILRLDEVDSLMDVSLRLEFMEKILNLPLSQTSQIFLVTHNDKYSVSDSRIRFVHI